MALGALVSDMKLIISVRVENREYFFKFDKIIRFPHENLGALQFVREMVSGCLVNEKMV